MRIPQSPRVVFGKNPLAEVICQLKFPRLLEIEQDLPVEFHRALRKQFPAIDVRPTVELSFNDLESGRPPSQVFRKQYDFRNDEDSQRITLASDFVAITFTKYVGWSEFRARVVLMMDAVLATYEVPHLERIGLRYKDIIDRSALGLEGVGWQELLRPEVLGIAATDILEEGELAELTGVSLANVGKARTLRIQTGLVKRVDADALGFLIDADFAALERVEAGTDVCTKILDDFNAQAGDFFRWCITPKLREALQPL